MTSAAVPTVTAINGSERVDGDTAHVLDHCTRLFQDRGVRPHVVQLARVSMTACGACGDCNTRTLRCDVIDDVEDIVATMSRSDGVLYATPVHGFGTASLMQTFLERAGVGHLRFDRPLLNKVGGALVVARRYAPEAVMAQLTQNILLNRMILAGSGFPAVLRTEGGRSPLTDVEGITALEAMVERMCQLIFFLKDTDTAGLGGGPRNEREQIMIREQLGR